MAQARPKAARWIVLTPSADDAAWRREIGRAVKAAGLRLVAASTNAGTGDDIGLDVIMITDDAARALASDATTIVAIMPEPESAPDAVAEIYHLHTPQNVWHSSTLLARAMALADEHSIITASDLAKRPRLLRLFGLIELIPPSSIAEVSKRPAVAAAFNIYRNPAGGDGIPVPWSERLFMYDEKAARNWPDWGILDITGRPRMLVWGPYLALPQGLWRAVIRFGVDQTAAGHQYRIDWGTRAACVSEHVTPGRAGMYEIQLEWLFEEADAAEIRLILTEGSFMGTVIFQGITVQRISNALNQPGHVAA